ncbi:hypothetical protein DFH07DRAFT_789783 [Mycena maculata]|uniref:Uncharacterized protein n=1 Tax=Mycena maculata TaxID=230809 RepID=A0AAD7KEI5_9AGAR|nr:hypothetical protein DFH07DRAFT_789783 [Mycena maculata]
MGGEAPRVPLAATTSTKRKSDASAGGGSCTKKAKTAPNFSVTKDLVDTLREDDDAEVTGADARSIAEYVRWLEGEVAATKLKENSKEEIDTVAEKLRGTCMSGIKKQMAWKPSCKTGGARWAYDGVCVDPLIFGALFHLAGPPKWKAQKYTVPEFEAFMGSINVSVRYDTLKMVGNVNVRYQAAEGTFKMSGSYGAPRHMNK